MVIAKRGGGEPYRNRDPAELALMCGRPVLLTPRAVADALPLLSRW